MTHADKIAAALRPLAPGGKLMADEVPLIDQLAAKWAAREVAAQAAPSQTKEPPWLVEARSLMGTREIPGPKHNSFISKGWARLGAPWFNDDETPWCGLFVAHCMQKAGLPYPGKGAFARALAWAEWGKACDPIVGAVAVFGRQGGGHVGFAVGQDPAGFVYVLGGNQSNAVNIMPIARSRLVGFRWPAGISERRVFLPAMKGGTISRNEA